MRVHNADNILDKTEFNNQTDWETYPTTDYTCDNCNQTVSLSLKDFTKHAYNDYSNLTQKDKQTVDATISASVDNIPSSQLDFYCPTCRRPVRIYYDSWAGGHHGEAGYCLKYVVD